jgi:hypothetical protein
VWPTRKAFVVKRRFRILSERAPASLTGGLSTATRATSPRQCATIPACQFGVSLDEGLSGECSTGQRQVSASAGIGPTTRTAAAARTFAPVPNCCSER